MRDSEKEIDRKRGRDGIEGRNTGRKTERKGRNTGRERRE